MRQWYEEAPNLLELEKKAMKDLLGVSEERLGYLEDGRAYWKMECTLTSGYERTYDFVIVYNADHPSRRCGGSVKVYFLKPTIEEMFDIVQEIYSESKRFLPDILKDSNGERYLGVSRLECTERNEYDIVGFSAAGYYRLVLKWINNFELGLANEKIWKRFTRQW